MGVNIKYQPVSWRIKIFNFLFVILIFAFLFLNLTYSQMISPLYNQIINGDKKSTVNFLQDIKNLPIFTNELNKSKKLFGDGIENNVFQSDIERNIKIKELEQVLQKNPQSRDILYGLFQLYSEKGDKITADKYLEKAKTVDPNIN